MAVFLLLVLAGCAPAALDPSSSAQSLIPATGPARIEIREYPLVEQSSDNPIHTDFQQYVPEAVAAQRDGWHFPNPDDALHRANRALEPFGFHLQAAVTPPFSSYSLMRGEEVVGTEIAHFWPVSLKALDSAGSRDFLLPFVTVDGDKLVASTAGVYPWPGEKTENTAPVYYGDQIAYAETHSGQLAVYAGPSLLYSAPEDEGVDVLTGLSTSGTRSMFTWTKGGGAEQHWALELEGRLIIDGEEINAHGYEESFGFTLINSQPFYFATEDSLTRITYNGKTLPYIYDEIVHDQSGALHVFNPGSNDRVVWFYALRDGLWYYVEAGVFE